MSARRPEGQFQHLPRCQVGSAAGALTQGALPRERRDKDAVLRMCAGLLVLLEVLLEPGQLISETPPVRQV